MTQLPHDLAKKLSELVPHDSVLLHDDHLGWFYQKSSNSATGSDSKNKQVNQMGSQNDREMESQLETLGPFGIFETRIKFSRIADSTDWYEIKPDEKLEFFRRILPDGIISGQHAPLAPVTLSASARQAANIPQNATHFCWVYPPIGFTQLSEQNQLIIDRKLADGDADFTFVALGGFVYFLFDNKTYRVLRVNTLAKANNGLVFNGPHAWRSEYTGYLLNRGRFQQATISELLERGVKYYCFINPNEQLESSNRFGEKWRPAQNGGFVYLYDKQMRPHRYDHYFSIADQPLSNRSSAHIKPFSLIRNPPKSSPASDRQQSATTDDENNRYICVVCCDKTIQCLFIPCRHVVACLTCAERIRSEMNGKCPVCREQFVEIWNVFL